MNWKNDIEDCCVHIESNKITDRKKYCDKLSNILEKKEVIALLNDGAGVSWKLVISSVQECLRKDADKTLEVAKKNTSNTTSNTAMYAKYPSANLFTQIIKTATREAPEEVNIPKLFGYIIGCMRDQKMKICYEQTFLHILQECILSNCISRGKLESDDWRELYTFLKSICEQRTSDIWVYTSFMLLIKWGPLSGLPPSILREEFGFITKICQLVSQESPKIQQENMLEIAIDFCKHTAKDNRVSCCKFGEDILSSFRDLYEPNGREARTKEQLIEFCLLQMTIHQPNGVPEGHPCAYAFSWNTWKRCLKMIYSLLSREIHFFFKFFKKNSSFFITNGDSVTLSEEFSALFVDVSRQLFTYPDNDVTLTLDCTLASQGPQKRQKIEISLKTYISNIQETKSWLWIHLVCCLIKKYPDLITTEDYLALLQILSNIQIESNDPNTANNIYVCLSMMLDISNLVDTSFCQLEIDKLWRVIGDNTTRAFGLNQHKESTEILLQKLIKRRVIDLNDILQTYTSGVLNISVQSIKTLDTGLQHINFVNLEQSKKELIMNCILNPHTLKDCKYLADKKTARVLVNLLLKQWPLNNDDNEQVHKFDKYEAVKDIYFKTILEKNILMQRKDRNSANSERSYDVDPESSQLLINVLQNFVSYECESIEVLLSIVILLMNISSHMIVLKILSQEEVNNFVLVTFIETILNKDVIKNGEVWQYKNERDTKKLIEYVDILNTMFTLDVDIRMMTKIMELIPFELLRSLVAILNSLQEEQSEKSELKFELKKAITKTLSSFSCVPGEALNQNQLNLLEVMATPNYNCNLNDDYILLLTFLSTLKLARPGLIPDVVFDNILKSIQEMCSVRYECHDHALEILNILLYLYPHLALSNDQESKSISVALLKPFYDNIKNYGPAVSVSLLKCLGRLIQLDPRGTFSRWSDVEVIKYVPNFLCSDYQEVRFQAIETLLVFFQVNSQSKKLQDFHRQEEIFSKVYDMSLKVFEVTGEITQERRVDEIISRTASVLHTFASIIINCDNWVEECLFALIKISYRKNIESVDKILSIVNQHLFGEDDINIMEKYLEHNIKKWLNGGYDFDNFQFKLFRCESKSEFYLKYFEVCVPFLIVNDRKDLIVAAKQLGYAEKDIVEKTCPKIFAQAICSDIENIGEGLIERNKILSYYSHIVGLDILKAILVKNLAQVLLNILSYLTDEKYIRENFEETVIFLTKNLTHDQVKTCFSFIESFLFGNQQLLLFLTKNNLNNLEKVLLSLKSTVFDVLTTDDKIKSLQRYHFFVSMVVENLNVDSDWQVYFIRDTTYSLINLIEHHQHFPEVVSAATKFLGSFLRKILPVFVECFEAFLMFTVNSLKHFASQIVIIREQCMNILTFLIVENSCHLMSSIQKLDSFPQHPDFDKIRKVHKKIKYGNNDASLEDEINFFLQHDDLTTGQDSLIHLRKMLSERKLQLKLLYDNLQNIRGFSEDCEKSSLHRLICMLAKMSRSLNDSISFEAIKCLGELGPANLRTLVLQPEKTVSDLKCSAFELLSGHVVTLLSECIIDCDINVVKNASEALYIVLNCKEGRKVGDLYNDYGCGPINKKHILPYFPLTRSFPSSGIAVDIEIFKSRINLDVLWCPDTTTCHKKWIVSLVTALLDTFNTSSYLKKLVSVCRVKVEFSEQLLPLIVNLMLSINNNTIAEVLSSKIDYFFYSHWKLTVPQNTENDSITVNKKSVKCMLEVVRFVRLQQSFNKSTRSRHLADLKINYLKVAKAAEFCSAHFTALLYSELWCQTKIEEIQSENPVISEQRSTMLDFIYEREGDEVGEALQNILRNTYNAIGDLDALPGCGISFLLKPQFRVEHYKELGKWDQVTHFYAIQMSNQINSVSKDFMESFKKSSLYQVPLLCMKESEEPEYECLWRLGQWNTGERKKIEDKNSVNLQDFEKYRFYALKSLHDNNWGSFNDAKRSQSLCVIDHLRHTSLESSQNLYPILTQLQALIEMEDFADAVTSKRFLMILNKWKLQDNLVRKNDFQYVEPVIAQRMVMLSNYLKENNDDDLKKYLINMTLDFAGFAKQEGYFKEGLTVLENLKSMSDLSADVQNQIQLIDAQLSWMVDNQLVARHILNKLCKNNEVNTKLRSSALKLYGQYKSETYSENTLTIISDYFLKSVLLMKNVERTADDNKAIMDTYDKVAMYADREYQQIFSYMKSDLFQRKVVNMEKAKLAASNIHKQRKRTHDELRAASIHNKQSVIDETEINTTKHEINQFLTLALKYYQLRLSHNDENNIRIFRIMSLFFENRTNEAITDTIQTQLPKIPIHKYITMLPQLIPHITETSTDLFSQKVNEIVEKCAIEHPHHTLPLLLSLANANKDREFNDQKTKTSTNDNRIATATNLLAKLMTEDELGKHVKRLQYLSSALIDLAYYKDEGNSSDTKTEFKIPKSQKITKIKNYDDILVPTYNLPVSQSGNYSNIVGISSFDSVYHPVGGINTPKQIKCRGTDGKVRSQLVKGRDDLRQDAVMQQVFTIMNDLLSTNKQTRNLLIRTYKIVPLSMRSGILEWVDNSVPIGEYLVGKEGKYGAHQVFRPNDKSPASCKNMFKQCAGKPPEEKLKTYKAICKDFKPVFHKFFEHKFPQPTIWYERRRAYIHSVATSSMCGYVLGIGDRHVSNILIDENTAEVIHIDFGIAFEQGRVLPTPETVPFRLSRDVVDGMGVSGVEGIFRRSCEKTMEVLRKNAQTIITILEVLLYDPLYAWTVTAEEANKRQTDDDSDVETLTYSEEECSINVTAERALLRLREKLQGTELGHPTSIEHQVGTLIQQAIDPANLCKLFCGWQPYL